MRGKDAFQRKQLHEVGITPACAGKSLCNLYISVVPKDHPRVCGEKRYRLGCGHNGFGSPPRVRGKDPDAERGCERGGITPACAGKRSARHWKRPATRDHPRVCGEKGKKPSQVTLEKGSPPRVRGKVLHQRPELCSHGITPACAGKRHPCKVYRVAVQDHPRVCGEKIITRARLTMWAGSPPRVRGKARRTPTQPRKPRITPACAGKRCS